MVDSEYRTLARLGGDPGERGEKGGPGPQGEPGERGLPGTNAVENDTAFATYAGAGDTETFQSIDKTWAQKGELSPLTSGVAAGFANGTPVVGYGHSFIAGTGLSASQYWANMVAAYMGVAYTNRGVGGSLAEDSAWRMWGNDANGFTIGSKSLVIIENMLNSLRLNGVDAPTWRGVNYAVRAMCAIAAAKSFFAADNARFSYGAAGWGAVTANSAYPGGKYRATLTTGGAGAYVEFTTTTTAKGTQLLTLARKVGLAQGLTEIRRMDTNAVILLWDNKDNAASGIAQNYAPVAFTLDVPRGTVIRITNLANDVGTGSTTICGLLERDPVAPNPVILMKEPKLANWAASTMFPNGSDEAVDYFNGIIDTIASEQSNVIAVAPEPWWTKQNAATLVQDDEVHPTLDGNRRLRDAALAAVSGQALRGAARTSVKQVDTGWADLAAYIGTGFTGTLQGRRIGDDICIVGNLTGTVPNGAQQAVTTALPAEWGSIVAGAVGAAFFGGTGAQAGVVRMLNTRIINATQNSGADKTTVLFTLKFTGPVA
jgi:hypothetical protein